MLEPNSELVESQGVGQKPTVTESPAERDPRAAEFQLQVGKYYPLGAVSFRQVQSERSRLRPIQTKALPGPLPRSRSRVQRSGSRGQETPNKFCCQPHFDAIPNHALNA